MCLSGRRKFFFNGFTCFFVFFNFYESVSLISGLCDSGASPKGIQECLALQIKEASKKRSHRSGSCHRDIKCSNVMMLQDQDPIDERLFGKPPQKLLSLGASLHAYNIATGSEEPEPEPRPQMVSVPEFRTPTSIASKVVYQETEVGDSSRRSFLMVVETGQQ